MADLATAYVRLIPSLKGAEATITQELSGASSAAGSKAGKGLGDALASGASGAMGKVGGLLSSAAGIAGRALAAGTVAAAGGIAAMGKAAMDSYAQYEQLAGGAELAFGGAYDFIVQKSQEAFSTVQMSQNDYLEQVNGLAVGLREAMGGDSQAAAELADKVVTAEADIVSAMGISQESAQNAFNGIMKGNFQMLDNLQLGITPTKEGMQEVIDKVNEWRVSQGQAGDLTIDNLADCQAAVVDYVEMMGYAGYAGREGMTTIEGSLNATKAAWSNLLTEMGKEDGDISARMGELASSATTLLVGAVDENGNQLSTGILGRAQSIVSGLAAAMPTMMPIISQALATALPQVLQIITTMLPMAIQLVTQLLASLGAMLPTLFQLILPVVAQQVVLLINTLTQNMPAMFAAAGQLFGMIAQAIATYGPQILTALGTLLVTLVFTVLNNVPGMLSAAGQLFMAVVTAIGEALPQVLDTAGQMLSDLWDRISSFDLASAGADLVQGLINGIGGAIGGVADALMGGLQSAVDSALSFLGIASPSRLFDWVGQMSMEGLAGGVADNVRLAERSMTDAMDALYGAAGGRAAAMGSARASASVASTAADGGGTASMLGSLRSDLSNMRIYLDGNALVGGISTRMDRALVM